MEVILYLFGGWRLVFSKSFRKNFIAKFRKMSHFRKCIEIIVTLVSISVSTGLPVLAIYFLFTYGEVNSSIDSCLDSGGSFNYLECECDYRISHPYIGDHQCD